MSPGNDGNGGNRNDDDSPFLRKKNQRLKKLQAALSFGQSDVIFRSHLHYYSTYNHTCAVGF